MPNGQPNVSGMVNDADFQALSPADKRSALSKLTGDKSFADLSDADTMQFVSRMTQPKAIPGAPAGLPQVPPATLPAGLTDVSPYGAAKGGGFLKSKAAQEGTLGEYSQAASMPFMALGGADAVQAPLQAITGAASSLAGGAGLKYGAQKAGLGPTGQAVAETAGQFGAGILGLKGGAKLADILPNAERAGNVINTITGTLKNTSVPVFDATAEAGRAMQLGDAGMTPPPVIRKFYARVTNPEKPPLNLEEARDLYTSGSKTTAKVWSELAAPQQRQTALFTKALGQNIADAVDSVQPGSGQQLQQALDEYHHAMMISSGLKGTATTMGKSAIRAVPWGAGAAAGGGTVYEALKFLKGKQ